MLWRFRLALVVYVLMGGLAIAFLLDGVAWLAAATVFAVGSLPVIRLFVKRFANRNANPS